MSNFQSPRGFTFVEMLLSLAIISIVLLGAQSAVLVASKSIPDNRSTSMRVATAASAIDRLAAELTYAISIDAMTATAIAFKVADRNGDGQPETIRYEWSGVTRAPLTRQYNGGTAFAVSEHVQDFQLAYDKRTTPGVTSFAEGSESLLAGNDSSSSLSNAAVSSTNWRAQHFTPALPADAVSWRVTRAWIKVRKRGSSDGVTNVQLRPAVNGKPSDFVLDQVQMLESSLGSSYVWQEINFSTTMQLGPSTALCLVLQWISDNDSCEVQYRNNLLFGGSVNCFLTGNGSGWSTSNDVMQYAVAGTVTMPTVSASTSNLTAVRCTIQASSDAASRVTTSIRTLNEPAVGGP